MEYIERNNCNFDQKKQNSICCKRVIHETCCYPSYCEFNCDKKEDRKDKDYRNENFDKHCCCEKDRNSDKKEDNRRECCCRIDDKRDDKFENNDCDCRCEFKFDCNCGNKKDDCKKDDNKKDDCDKHEREENFHDNNKCCCRPRCCLCNLFRRW